MNSTTLFNILSVSDASWDGAGDVISYSTLKLIHTIFNIHIASVISLIGVPTNAVNCLVFWRLGLRDRVNLCLFSLALVDLSILLSNFITAFPQPFIELVDRALQLEYVMKSLAYFVGVTHGLRATSDLISMIIAVDRCLCVLLPLHVTRLVRTRTMAGVILASFLFLQLCYVGLTLRFTVVQVYVNSTGTFLWKTVPTDMGIKHARFLDAITSTFLSICLPVFSFVIVSIATVVTVWRLRSARRWREKTTSTRTESRDRQAAATHMVVLVSCLYIGTMAPSVASIIARLIVPDFSPYGRYYNLYMSIISIADQLSFVNNAVCFWVYLAQSSRFRDDLRAVCSCGQNKHSSPCRPSTTAASACLAS